MAQKVSELMTSAPVALRSSQSVADAARAMRDHDVGDVLVVDDGQLKGLVTDRDIVVRAAAVDRDLTSTALSEICSPDLITVAPGDEVGAAVRAMREHAVRRIPVTEDGHAVGVLSIGDTAIERDERSALADISAERSNKLPVPKDGEPGKTRHSIMVTARVAGHPRLTNLATSCQSTVSATASATGRARPSRTNWLTRQECTASVSGFMSSCDAVTAM